MDGDPITIRFEDDGVFPNSVLPVLIYRGAVAPHSGASAYEALFSANFWPPQWRNGIYDYHHFHSTAHEVLGIAGGRAVVMLGGPKGETLELIAGDVVVLPAGVAHRRIEASEDFLVVGAYPPDQDADLLRGEDEDRARAMRNIKSVPKPQTDPVRGKGGPLSRVWS